MSKIRKKAELTLLGCLFSLFNILLIDTRFNIVGLFFGIVSFILLIQALRTKE